MTSGPVDAMANGPTEARLKWPSEMFFQYPPASSVFHTPPPVEPKKKVARSRGCPATATTRPARYGPMHRQLTRSSASRVGEGLVVVVFPFMVRVCGMSGTIGDARRAVIMALRRADIAVMLQ